MRAPNSLCAAPIVGRTAIVRDKAARLLTHVVGASKTVLAAVPHRQTLDRSMWSLLRVPGTNTCVFSHFLERCGVSSSHFHPRGTTVQYYCPPTPPPLPPLDEPLATQLQQYYYGLLSPTHPHRLDKPLALQTVMMAVAVGFHRCERGAA